ncbi:BCCT family transporter [Pseudomonas sp. A4]|nr:BCCT family transporter [Pseudomonas sp. S11A4]
MPPETQLFGIFNELPFGFILSIVALALIASFFFITSADSMDICTGNANCIWNIKSFRFYKKLFGVWL